MDNPSDLQRQLSDLRQTVTRLESRIVGLEKKLPAPLAPSATLPVTTILPVSATTQPLYPGLRWLLGVGSFLMMMLSGLSLGFFLIGLIMLLVTIIWPWHTAVKSKTAPGVRVVSATGKAIPPPPRVVSQFEQDLARHWLSWLGIITLVVGVTLFLGYSLRTLGPLGNIITGYFAAAALFGLWMWFKKNYRGFAFILQSGAWALVYISTFALHTVNPAPIESPIIGGYLLLVVTAMMVMSAWTQNSRSLTAGAFLLGYITAFTSPVSTFMLSCLLILSLGLVTVAAGRRWAWLIISGNAATYLTQFIWMTYHWSNLREQAPLAAGFLIAQVLVYGAAHWVMNPEHAADRRLTMAGSIVNLAGFFGLFSIVTQAAGSNNVWLATMFLAAVTGLLAWLASFTPSRRYLQAPYIVFSVAFLTVGLAQWTSGQILTISWVVEAGALVIAGALARHRVLRVTGYIVAVLALYKLLPELASNDMFGSTSIHARLLIGWLAAAVYGLVAAILRLPVAALPPEERSIPSAFTDVGIGLAAYVTASEIDPAWVPVLWSVAGAAIFAFGATVRSVNLRVVGHILVALAVGHWMVAEMNNDTALTGSLAITSRLAAGMTVVLMLLSLSALSQKYLGRLSREEQPTPAGYSWVALFMLVVVLGAEVPTRLLSVGWGLIGITWLAYGFARSSSTARRQGLTVLTLTVGKVYLYDVSTLAPKYRIISFVLLGGILLLVGFWYNRWRQTQQLKPPTKS